MTVQEDWIRTLRNQTYDPATTYIHTRYGFDPLGVLVEMFRVSSYSFVSGQGVVAVSLLEALAVARATLHAAILSAHGTPPAIDPALGDAIAASFWATDTVTTEQKAQIKTWQDAIDVEYSLYVPMPALYSVQTQFDAYSAARDNWISWLISLSGAGGWRGFLNDWETAQWVLDPSQVFYSYNGVSTKLPEAVQRWSDVLQADPILTLSDSTAGEDVLIPLNLIVDGVVMKVDPGGDYAFGTYHRLYTEAEIIDLLEVYLGLAVL